MTGSRILVDADACPVKDEFYKVAWRRGGGDDRQQFAGVSREISANSDIGAPVILVQKVTLSKELE